MKKRYQVLTVLSLLSMITFLDRIALSSASTSIMGELHISTVQWGWILGMFTIAYAAFEIPASTTNVYSVPFVNPVTVALHELVTHTEADVDAVPFVYAPVVFLLTR